MQNKVEFSAHFTTLYDSLPPQEQDLIDEFIYHFRSHGLKTFEGKKGPTDNVPTGDKDRAAKVAYAKKQKLWHAHVGHPKWNTCRNPLGGYKTSDYVVHFQKFNETFIALVDYDSHRNMQPPARDRLFKRI
ncbi:hypothetical protein [Pseudomonas sp. GL-RE-20]|uniref:hypothetical protein n=1 Tax=Pseudomonas sp. GL-RE-20 TaxID=2832372 RepID=UPI001CBE3B6D|nr:hypothetical protein [Pseudomonas sp. GL-RE-20]